MGDEVGRVEGAADGPAVGDVVGDDVGDNEHTPQVIGQICCW